VEAVFDGELIVDEGAAEVGGKVVLLPAGEAEEDVVAFAFELAAVGVDEVEAVVVELVTGIGSLVEVLDGGLVVMTVVVVLVALALVTVLLVVLVALVCDCALTNDSDNIVHRQII
jgi:hypothetical protein